MDDDDDREELLYFHAYIHSEPWEFFKMLITQYIYLLNIIITKANIDNNKFQICFFLNSVELMQ